MQRKKIPLYSITLREQDWRIVDRGCSLTAQSVQVGDCARQQTRSHRLGILHGGRDFEVRSMKPAAQCL
jgi:hypothetical protein